MSASKPLSAERCMALLGAVDRGHLAASVHALPAVMPVRHTVDADGLLITCHDDAFLRACGGSVVAFSADEVDADDAGWTVQVVGEAAYDEAAHLLRIALRVVDGRVLGAGRAPEARG